MAKKILVTDDQKDLVEAMKVRLEKEGYDVITAYDGEECLDKLRSAKPDLMIMDVSMPKKDGFSVVRDIKSDQALDRIPIIILTGKDQMEDIFKMEGVQEYIVKPFETDALIAMVKKHLT